MSSVVLPHPLGPMSDTNSFSLTSKLIPRSAWIGPRSDWYTSARSRTVIIRAAELTAPSGLRAQLPGGRPVPHCLAFAGMSSFV